MIDYLNPGKTTTGQYYAEPTFKLLEVVKQKQWRKLSLGSWTFSWQCTSGAQQALGNCESVQLKHPAYNLDLAPSNYFLIRNLKYRLRGTWFIDEESPKIAVKAWSESQNRKFCFQGINSWEQKLKKCIVVAWEYVKKLQHVWYNMLTFYSQVARLFDRPSYFACIYVVIWSYTTVPVAFCLVSSICVC